MFTTAFKNFDKIIRRVDTRQPPLLRVYVHTCPYDKERADMESAPTTERFKIVFYRIRNATGGVPYILTPNF